MTYDSTNNQFLMNPTIATFPITFDILTNVTYLPSINRQFQFTVTVLYTCPTPLMNKMLAIQNRGPPSFVSALQTMFVVEPESSLSY